jgi:hypothetical protein
MFTQGASMFTRPEITRSSNALGDAFPIIVESREASNRFSDWEQYLCLRKGDVLPYRLFIGADEFLADADDYLDADTGDHKLPKKINGRSVNEIKYDQVIGFGLYEEKDNEDHWIEFSALAESRVVDWLKATAWHDTEVTQLIQDAIAQLDSGS